MAELVQVITTVDSEPEALRLAKTMVTERLAACAQIHGPIESVYRWQDDIVQATEWSCHFKTTKPLAHHLRTRIVSEHAYDVPEVIVVPILDVHTPYANWVVAETQQPESDF